MNVRKNLFVLVAVAAIGLTPALAFHSGGVAECGGCHSMHSPAAAGYDLLIRQDASSTCLSCHAANDTAATFGSYHIMTYPVPGAGLPPVELSPGGDFAWLLKNYSFTVRGTVTNEAGQTHGHNVIAADFGLSVDTDNATAPGGTFASSQLGCQSCHDQHGKLRRIGGDTTYTFARTGAPIIGSGSYNNSAVPTATQAVGAYRLLRGGVTGAFVDDEQAGVTYASVMIASVPSTYNRTELTTQTRTAYGSAGVNTVGQWCASCHPGMHSSGNYVHPIDTNLDGLATNYNSYTSSGIMTGTSTTAYLSLVPVAENTGDYTVLKVSANNNGSDLNGPGTSDKVMCFSCHRAHATGFPDMLRWNYEGEFITVADSLGNPIWPGTDNGAPVQFARGKTELETRTAYYLRPATVFGAYQRQLCNKCHAKD